MITNWIEQARRGTTLSALAAALALAAVASLAVAAPPARAADDPLALAGAQPACSGGLCGASGLSAKALNDFARADRAVANVSAPASAGGSDGARQLRDELRRAEPSRDPWNRHMPVRPDLESYDCILSFGVGGEMAKGGFVGSRVLGQTQSWRAPDR
jgi:hypothetical protein